MEGLLLELLGWFLPVIVGFLTRYVYQGTESLVLLMEKLPPWAKKLAVVLVAFILTKLSAFTGVPLPGDLAGLTPEIISSLLSAAGAIGLHELSNKALANRNTITTSGTGSITTKIPGR